MTKKSTDEVFISGKVFNKFNDNKCPVCSVSVYDWNSHINGTRDIDGFVGTIYKCPECTSRFEICNFNFSYVLDNRFEKGKITLENSYIGLSEEDIRNMPHEELVNSVIRMLKTPMVNCEDWYGSALLPDIMADAFRNLK